MSGVGMDTLNFVVYMALLTEGALLATVSYKHGPPGGGQAHHFSAKQESRMAGKAAGALIRGPHRRTTVRANVTISVDSITNG